MKKSILFAAVISFAGICSLFASCGKDSRLDFTYARAELPAKVGADIFCGKTFDSSYRRYEFSDDGKVTVYSLGWEALTEDRYFFKDYEAEYSFNTDRQELYMRNTARYIGETRYTDLSKYIEARFRKQKKEVLSMIDNAKVDSRSVKNFKYLIKQVYANDEKIFIENVKTVSYRLSMDGLSVYFTDEVPSQVNDESFYFFDKPANVFYVGLTGNSLQIEPNNPYYAYTETEQREIVYMGILKWERGHRKFSGELYKIDKLIKAPKNEVTVSFVQEISGQMETKVYTKAAVDSLYKYFIDATLVFDGLPDELTPVLFIDTTEERNIETSVYSLPAGQRISTEFIEDVE